MNVAIANTVGYGSTAFMSARSAEAGVPGAETRTPPEAERGEEAGNTFTARYPMVALSYDQDASRLVMLFRDPETGNAVAQIPSKVVVKQYQEAQIERRRDETRKFEVVVGGADEKDSGGADASGGKTGLFAGGDSGSGATSVGVGGSSAGAGSSGGARASGGGSGSGSGGASVGGSVGAGAGSGAASPVGGGSVASVNVVV